MSDRSLEEPEEDVAEQRRGLRDDTNGPDDRVAKPPLDVNEADAAEQELTVDLDEDEYR
ncbi:MAG TPA: hypothetical protein VGS62_06715 [Streptosporangiaceae bacterium]|nr:hypothetical protein [Streptosporangiaceae bacterium]